VANSLIVTSTVAALGMVMVRDTPGVGNGVGLPAVVVPPRQLAATNATTSVATTKIATIIRTGRRFITIEPIIPATLTIALTLRSVETLAEVGTRRKKKIVNNHEPGRTPLRLLYLFLISQVELRKLTVLCKSVDHHYQYQYNRFINLIPDYEYTTG
jgi:hypothetical protein